MSEEEQLLLMIKGAISDLPAEERTAFDRCNAEVREALKAAPLDIAILVVAFIGAELQLANS
jgi:hypothetical protein